MDHHSTWLVVPVFSLEMLILLPLYSSHSFRHLSLTCKVTWSLHLLNLQAGRLYLLCLIVINSVWTLFLLAAYACVTLLFLLMPLLVMYMILAQENKLVLVDVRATFTILSISIFPHLFLTFVVLLPRLMHRYLGHLSPPVFRIWFVMALLTLLPLLLAYLCVVLVSLVDN